MHHAHVNVKTRVKMLRRHQNKLLPLGDDITEIIRQAAICERNKSIALKHNNLSVLVIPTQSCRRARAACNAADDNNFHSLTPFPPHIACFGRKGVENQGFSTFPFFS